MKIVHVSTFDVGGAATSALRLHEGLLQQGINSFFLCLYKTGDKANTIQFTQSFKKSSVYKRIKERFGLEAKTQLNKDKEFIKNYESAFEKYSFPFSDYFVENDALLKTADIIHLHWVADFINYPSFFAALDKPIVWTLHDMNPILGGFHYSVDKEKYKGSFTDLEARLSYIKSDTVAKAKKLAIVTPSKWLGKAAQSSAVFKHADLFRYIPYGLDCQLFKTHSPSLVREVFNLPPNKKIILFVSESLNNYRKGFDLLLDAIEGFGLDKEFTFVAAGSTNKNLSGKDYVIKTGRIKDERLMSLLYSAADLFVLPSREDNFPNVMLEAFACGTPVLSFKTGGMTEVIQEGFNGFFAENIDAASLANAIKRFCNGDYMFNREEVRRYAEDTFSLELQALQYKKLYEEMLVNTA